MDSAVTGAEETLLVDPPHMGGGVLAEVDLLVTLQQRGAVRLQQFDGAAQIHWAGREGSGRGERGGEIYLWRGR